MKKIILASSLVALSLFGLMGMGGSKQEPPKAQFAVVEISKLYQESAMGKAGVARLESVQNEAIAKLESMQAEAQKAKDAKDEATSQRIQVEMQSLLYTLQSVVSAEQDKVVKAIEGNVAKILDKYREDNGLSGIVGSEAFLSYGKDIDATAAVMALLDKETVDFGPMPSLDNPAQSAAPAAQASEEEQNTPKAESAASEAPKDDDTK